jgi:hypothetical protein
MLDRYHFSGNGDKEKEESNDKARKDIDESTTHERDEPDSEPPTDRQENNDG